MAASAFRLPAEVLASCFVFLPFRDVLAVSHVSHYWRNTALSCPALWTQITITRAFRSITRADFLDTAMARAGGLSVHFRYLKPAGRVPTAIIEAVADYMHRFRVLEWSPDHSVLDLILPAPLMRDLVLRGEGVFNIPSKFLGGTIACLRTLILGVASFPASCPVLETVVHLRASYPDYVEGEPDSHFQHLFSLCPHLQTLDLRKLPFIAGTEVPTGPAPRTLTSVWLMSYEECDFVRLYNVWELYSVPYVQLRIELEQAPDTAGFLTDALTLSLAYALDDANSDESQIVAQLPLSRRRTVICDDIGCESNRDEMLAGILSDDAALVQLHTLSVPLGILAHVVPRWPCLAHLTIHVFESDEWRYDTGRTRYLWDQLRCLRAAHGLSTLALCVHQDFKRTMPPTVRDAHDLLEYIDGMSSRMPPEVLVYGFPEDVMDNLPSRYADSPRVVFMSTSLHN